MVNIEKITSTLAKLPDESLQRYAAMHKDDPYILALAVSESNRRKEMRAAGQAQPMQQQPKVVDQAVAEMATQQMPAMPEEQGIGGLPAAQQMNFADGGITGYAGGGEVERYNGSQSSLTGGGVFDQFDRQKANRLSQLNSQLATIEPQLRAAAASGDQMAIQQYAQQAQAIRNQINVAKEEAGNRIGAIESLMASPAATPIPSAAPIAAQGAPIPKPEDISGIDRRLATPGATLPMSANITRESAGSGEGNRNLGGGEGKRNLGAGTREIGAGAPAKQADMITSAKDLAGNLYDTREQDLALGAFRNFTTQRAAEIEDAFAKRPTTKAMEGFEKSLKEEAEKEAGEKDEAKGMAIFKAGLAMMSGSSPHALVNIGKGAMAGAEEYSGALKEFKKAAKDRQRLFAEIEEKRRLQELGDFDAAAAKDQKIFDLQNKFEEKVLAFTEKTTGAKNEMAAGLVKRELDEQAAAKRSAQSFANQLKLRDMPTYEQGLQKQYIQQWLNKPENKGKTEIDAVMSLGLLGNQPRGATPTDLRMTAKEILDNPMDYSEADVAAARQVMRGVLGVQGAGSAGKFTVTAGGKTYTFPTQEAANKFKAEAGVK